MTTPTTPQAPGATAPAPGATAPAPGAKTLSLLPGFAQDAKYRLVSVDELPPDSELYGPDPDRQMLKSIEGLGVLTPVILVEEADGTLRVAEGRRRVKAARRLLLGEVPAHIYPAHWTDSQVLALATNAHRSANPLSDYIAIKSLTAQGADVDAICGQLGLDRALVKSRMGLDRLCGRLYGAMLDGKVPVQVAVEAAGCEPELQDRLADKLDQDGRLRVADVRAAKRVASHAGVDGLPDDLFDVPNAAAPAPVAPPPAPKPAPTVVYRMDPDGMALLQAMARVLGKVKRASEATCDAWRVELAEYLDTKVGARGADDEDGAQDGTTGADTDGDAQMEGE